MTNLKELVGDYLLEVKLKVWPWYVASIKFAVLMKCKCFKLPLLLANALSFHKQIQNRFVIRLLF